MLVEKLQELLNEDAVVKSLDKLKLDNTECIDSNVLCSVIPFKVEVVRTLLEFANESAGTNCSFSIYPISSGKNWGYGSSLPSTINGNVVLLDLKELKDISFYDSENGLITIQPGVTQKLLYDFLDVNGADFMVPVTGAGPTTSVLSNALERGYGITPVADHFSAVTSIKGYLADGSFYESSLQAMANSSDAENYDCYVDKTFKWKHGPYLDGIFTQSGNIIVTEVTISLARIKPAFDSFYMRFYSKDSFENAFKTVKETFNELEGIVGSINLMDKRRVAAMVAKNPQGNGNHKVMTQEQLESISKTYNVPEWTIVGTIYGSKKVARAAKKDIKRIAAKKSCQILFSSDWIVKLGQYVVKKFNFSFLTSAREQLDKLSAGMEVMQGKPNQVALPLAYWRNPRVTPDNSKMLNPAEDGCGLLWYAPLVPSKAEDMEKFVAMVREVTPQFNIEPMITFTNLSSISTDSTIPIVFDTGNPQAVIDAHNCLNTLYSEGLKKGFIPYRLNIKQQKKLDSESTFWKAAGKISSALDPNGVISPDRYNPSKF